ncbi:telomere repeat-binding protein 2-like [Phalaenopsis equestris]|uniref:telomere repeat-binding protein 2-like n=1 Tax=Phalaenopsis equestris TaxID=78828 RepID=UPI0009E47C34|nr:telomere repeat-binding protein 2-like [Phalaenopsis equestris]XP_020590403.1 telomere repeat-binding protein 2-like [Phalaenopsis equestris]XP_020590404.1 telomere repeat-binding protein 2-like [Phalaenopsis equestris]XP_020590405.1 telomere repeat-binding protein 2-like [Phalaenopsis equestris]
MVLRKRLDYRINGYHFPSFPQIPLSAKGKRSVRKRNVENRMCAFDLLAAVAGKLLERDKSSSTSEVPGSSMTLKLSGTSLVSFCSGVSNEAIMEERGSSLSAKVSIGDNVAENCKTTHSLEETVVDGNSSDSYNLNGSFESDVKPPLLEPESSMEVHISRDGDPYTSSFPHSWDGLELPVHSDDDENSSRCTHPCTTTIKASKPNIGEHRLGKVLASRHWKVDLGAAKHAELSQTDGDPKRGFRSRKISYKGQRTPRISFERRKLFNRYSISASHKGLNRAGVFNIFKKNDFLEGIGSAALHGVKGTRSIITEQLSAHKPEDLHVKLSIKSFIVPELFIEIPETATVGSLKRTVMEAITTIIGSGLRVGVLFQGKDVSDDDRTLIQAGISHANELDELSFSLEPNSTFPSASRYSNSSRPHLFLPCDSTEPLSRLPAALSFDQGRNDSSSYHALTSAIICHESNVNSDSPSADRIESVQALSARPAITAEVLSVVPADKLKRSELVQRRIRRPFTVSEVETLVKTVEKLGTGRWRDVKIQSFDDAKYRTYVDLKDKWKTLVHTARISPHHRRGEPVPQELLDRVLRAHAYWSHQQASLQPKSPSAEPCLGP